MKVQWHVVYKFGGSTYSADFKVVPGRTETEDDLRLLLARKNPTWEIVSIERRSAGMPPDDPGPLGVEGSPGE